MSEVDRLLHDADRKVMGANFARYMGDHHNAALLDRAAGVLYGAALAADPSRTDRAWRETGNRDAEWLKANGLARVPS
jgi:hypothetical protein